MPRFRTHTLPLGTDREDPDSFATVGDVREWLADIDKDGVPDDCVLEVQRDKMDDPIALVVEVRLGI